MTVLLLFLPGDKKSSKRISPRVRKAKRPRRAARIYDEVPPAYDYVEKHRPRNEYIEVEFDAYPTRPRPRIPKAEAFVPPEPWVPPEIPVPPVPPMHMPVVSDFRLAEANIQPETSRLGSEGEQKTKPKKILAADEKPEYEAYLANLKAKQERKEQRRREKQAKKALKRQLGNQNQNSKEGDAESQHVSATSDSIAKELSEVASETTSIEVRPKKKRKEKKKGKKRLGKCSDNDSKTEGVISEE